MKWVQAETQSKNTYICRGTKSMALSLIAKSNCILASIREELQWAYEQRYVHYSIVISGP
jgi:hypothetical protein